MRDLRTVVGGRVGHTNFTTTEGFVPDIRRIFKRSSSPTPRYYVYISQTKLDMLVPQIPASHLRSLEAEIKVNVAAVAVGVKKPASAPSPDLAAKTRVLCDYLEKQEGWIGTVANPGRYVKGTALLQYGVMRDYVAELVFFGGDVDGVKVGMIGSPASLIGAAADTAANHSLDYYTLKFLNRAAERDVSKEASADQTYEMAVEQALQDDMLPPNQYRLEFLARPLFHNDRLLVATPIYVALAD